ncbi:MAG: rubredoxin [Treponema sp.]|nr:rubredoxin [Treponema sp.]MBR0100243.1 rubredoxin [Treponema sp.]
MLANVSDVYRPAYEPDIRKRINVEFVRLLGNRNSSLITQPLNVWGYQTKSNYAELKRLLRYWDTNTNCCTRLGYTFDYAEINDTIREGYTKKDGTAKKSFIGVPEVIIRKGSTVDIIKKIPVEDFHEEVNCNKNFEKYFCSICGYVYLPAEHDCITFEELPDDWHCPRCKQPKDKFNKL